MAAAPRCSPRSSIRLGKNPGLDVFKLMDSAEELVPPVMQKPAEIDRAALTLGYCGVYSSFLRHAERAAERFGVDAREILTESASARRSVVRRT